MFVCKFNLQQFKFLPCNNNKKETSSLSYLEIVGKKVINTAMYRCLSKDSTGSFMYLKVIIHITTTASIFGTSCGSRDTILCWYWVTKSFVRFGMHEFLILYPRKQVLNRKPPKTRKVSSQCIHINVMNYILNISHHSRSKYMPTYTSPNINWY